MISSPALQKSGYHSIESGVKHLKRAGQVVPADQDLETLITDQRSKNIWFQLYGQQCSSGVKLMS